MLLLLLMFCMHQKDVVNTEASESSIRKIGAYLKKGTTFIYPGGNVDGWQEFENRIYILDQVAQQFYVFDFKGNLVDTLGVKGLAPWENQQIRRFRVSVNGIFALDNSHMSVKGISGNDEVLFYDKLSEPFWDGVYLYDEKFLLVNDESEAYGFYTWDARTNKQVKTIRFDSMPEIAPQKNLNIAFEGEMVQGDTRHFYVCNRAGMYLVISANGLVEKVGQTIDGTPPPKIVERRMNNMVVFERQPDEFVNYSATTDNEFLYILSTVAYEKTNNLSIDVYHADDGYRYSFEVPNHLDSYPVNIMKGEDQLWILYEDLYVISYEIIVPTS